MSYIRLTKDADGIVEFVFDQPGKSVNTMGAEYDVAMKDAIAQLVDMVSDGGVTGVLLGSGKPGQFFAGGDIKEMLEMPLDIDVAEKTRMFNALIETKAPLRTLETLGVPVVVCINGACLGGGFEIALACHHRIALSGIQLGLPEAAIGLMPGAGGVVRMTRLLGMQQAITLISQGKRVKSDKALELGLIDEVADSEEAMLNAAKRWLMNEPEATQVWDRPDYVLPGGSPLDKDNQEVQGLLFFGAANVLAQTKGLMPAQQAIFSCVVDGAKVDFDTAQTIEARYFLSLLLDQTARNMMLAFFVQMEALNKGASRPKEFPRSKVATLGILGAGQMGAGLAMAAASNGIKVFVKDLGLPQAEAAKAYAEKGFTKNKRMSAEKAASALALIHPTDQYCDLSECDAVIEAVFENRDVKAAVTREMEAEAKQDLLFASNTSALPITELAEASARPENFIGMHFFSPAERMPLVEIICGEKTSDEALARAFDLAQQLGKMPIVVNDSPGFFTTRVIGATITEGSKLVMEGVNPVVVESAARDNGSPIGPLTAIDEISQETAYKNGQQAKADLIARGGVWEATPESTLLERMVVEFGRLGKRHGAGYYDYPEGQPKRIWRGMQEHFAPSGFVEMPYEDVKDRLLYCQCLEAVRAMEEGVISSVGDGNIGSIMGIGFPAQTGGVFQCINGIGLARFAARCEELEERYGDRFKVPALVYNKIRDGELFL